MNNVLIIGAGVSGLSIASEVAKYLPTTAIDRLPLFGGTHAGYEDKLAISLKNKCDEAGVKFLLGNTAIRWSSDNQLLTVGPGGIQWIPGSHLVYAGGIRPSTQAELGILGSRLGGVLACTLAMHFLESGVRLGNRVVVIGAGNSASHIEELLAKQGSYVIGLPLDETDSRPAKVNEWWPYWTPLSFCGKGRVREIQVSKDNMVERIACDSVIFAARMKPLRNIDGAIFENECHDVTFDQLVNDTSTLEQRSLFSKDIAARLLTELRRQQL